MISRQSAVSPCDDPTSLGNLAIKKGYATREQVFCALKEQTPRLPLGELLLYDGVINEDQLEELLHIQKVKRAKGKSTATKLELLRQQKKAQEVASILRETAAVMKLFTINNGNGKL